MQQLVFATGNKNKLKEVRELLHQTEWQVIDLAALNCFEDIPETGSTLHENAKIKIQYLVDNYERDGFSEDTGLEVDALDGAPGVRTARFAGEACTAMENMQKLLRLLEGKKNRKARFKTVVALQLKNSLHFFEGVCEGSISNEISGNEGFGYDPIFIPEGYNKTFAELDSGIKTNEPPWSGH